MSDITVVFGFDSETDVGSWTPFYEGLQHGTPRILDLLAQKGVTSTFFFTGDAAMQHPEIVKQVAAAGHEVGAHSLYHETVGDPSSRSRGEAAAPGGKCPAGAPRHRGGRQRVGRAASPGAALACGKHRRRQPLEELGYIADASYPSTTTASSWCPTTQAARIGRKGRLEGASDHNFADMTIESKDPTAVTATSGPSGARRVPPA